MNRTKVPMTVEGAEALRAELKNLKSVVRPSIIQAISEAREHGDLRENAEYQAAKEQQSFTEGRIRDIESKLADAQVIDILALPNTGKVIFGSTVTLIDVETDESVSYRIVGEDEADLKQAKISVLSPIARALIGKAEGAEITVAIPSGERTFEISKVEHI